MNEHSFLITHHVLTFFFYYFHSPQRIKPYNKQHVLNVKLTHPLLCKSQNSSAFTNYFILVVRIKLLWHSMLPEMICGRLSIKFFWNLLQQLTRPCTSVFKLTSYTCYIDFVRVHLDIHIYKSIYTLYIYMGILKSVAAVNKIKHIYLESNKLHLPIDLEAFINHTFYIHSHIYTHLYLIIRIYSCLHKCVFSCEYPTIMVIIFVCISVCLYVPFSQSNSWTNSHNVFQDYEGGNQESV